MVEIVAVVSDLHINSTIGLCPLNGVSLDDGGTYRPSKEQRWLGRCWSDFWDRAQALGGDRLHVVINGDAVDGDHHDTPAIVTRNMETQVRMALAVLEPSAGLADRLYIMRGTEVHTGKQAQWEEFLAKDLDAVPDDAIGSHSWWWLPLEVGGVKFDIAHHPGTSSRRPWTRGAAANRLAAWILSDYAESRSIPPDVVIRSHNHIFEDSGESHPIRAIITPAWQLCTPFGHRIGGSGKLAHIGGLLFVCEGGQYTMNAVRYRGRRRSWQK